MASLGDLVVKLSLDAVDFDKGMEDAASDAEASASKIVAAGNLAAEAIEKIVETAAEGIKEAVSLLPEVAQQVFEQVDKLDEAAASVSLRLESFQKLQAAFAMGGVDAEQFATGLGKLNQAIVNAAAGEKVADTFAKLGVAVQDVDGNLRDTESVLRDVAAAFKELPEGPERSALAMELFGKAGKQFIPTLIDDLDMLSEHAEKVGAIFSVDLIAASHDYEQASAQLNQSLQGLKNTIAEDMLPAMADWKRASAEVFDSFVEYERDLGELDAATVAYNAVVKILAYTLAATADVVIAFKDALVELGQIAILTIKGLITLFEVAKAGIKGDAAAIDESLNKLSDDLDAFLKREQARFNRELLTVKLDVAFDHAELAGEFERAFQGLQAEAQQEAEQVSDMFAPAAGGTPTRSGGDSEAEKEYQARLRLALDEGKAEEEAHRDMLKRADAMDKAAARERESDAEKDWKARLDLALKEGKAVEEAHRDMLKRADEMDKQAAREMEADRKKQEKDAHDHAEALARNASDAYKKQAEINKQVQDIFTDPLADAFSGLIQGTKTVKEAFSDMAKSIVSSITAIVAKQLAVKAFEGVFGGTDPATGGGGIYSLIGSLIGGGHALGGPFQANQAIMVGERGPEWIRPNFAGTVEPMSSASTTHNNVSVSVRVPPATDRRSADQIGASIGLAVNRAMARTQ